jgi:hypothetical protein
MGPDDWIFSSDACSKRPFAGEELENSLQHFLYRQGSQDQSHYANQDIGAATTNYAVDRVCKK